MTALFEPAAAIAASHCLTARSVDAEHRTTTAHPRRCAWCEYRVEELRQLVDGFNEWAGWRERSRTYERHDVRVFAELPRERQQALVIEAQGFEFAESVEPAPSAQADEPAIDVVGWL